MSLSTHVLDAVTGRPAQDVPVRLERAGAVVTTARTDADGRVRDLGALTAGVHRLVFDTAAAFPDGFYPEVVVTFTVTDPSAHHHVPLLLSPFAYSTYRGS
ncbi:hydroxyisourate hydrolase [Pseudonocardia sp. CA-107938]|uniref:hydroxyisourate hydrolase n=1 Tax=Pseudonocardia sp. CA-107938 TaxID=3240021 RepID=UPI003D8B1476